MLLSPHILLPNRKAVVTSSPAAAIQGTTYWIAEGDSRSHSTTFASAGHLYPNQIFAAEPFIVVENIQAVDGSTLTDLINRAAADDAFIAANTGYANYVMSILIGVNSAVGAADYSGNPSGFLAALASYCDARRSAGWKVVVCTEIPAFTGSDATSYSSWRATVNTGIRSWVGVHADAIADLAANGSIGPDGAQLTGLWNVDNLHPNDSGHDIIFPIVQGAIRQAASVADSDPVVSVQTLWDSSKKHADITLSGSPTGRIATNSNGSAIRSVMSVSSHVIGRRHAEVQIGGASITNVIGLALPNLTSYTAYPGQNNGDSGLGFSWVGTQFDTSGTRVFTEINASSSSNFGPGHTVMYEVNFDLGYVWSGRDGTWDTNDPALLTNPNYTFQPHKRLYMAAGAVNALNSYTVPATPSFMSSGASPF